MPPSIDSLVSGMRAHLHQVRQKMVAKATIPTDVNLATSLYPGSPAGLTAFDKLDVNRDGVIDRDEFRQLTSAGVSVVTSPSKAGERFCSTVESCELVFTLCSENFRILVARDRPGL